MKKITIYFLITLILTTAGSLFLISNTNAQLIVEPKTVDEIQEMIKTPVPRIKIPGLEFSGVPEIVEEMDDSGALNKYFYFPYLGEYLAAIYKYAVAATSILAVLVIIISGIQWMLPGNLLTSGEGDQQQTINQSKKRIVGAIVGLLLALGSYTILYNINPDLVNFKSLKVLYIKGQTVNDLALMWENMGDTSIGDFDVETITDPNFHHSTIPAEYKLNNEMIRQIAIKNDIDICLAWTIIVKESGRNGLAVGHDENYDHNIRGDKCPYVGARAQFLISGQKYSGETFTPPAGCMWSTKKKPATCPNPFNPCTMNDYKDPRTGKILKNDDRFDRNNPPDYGLDWRFSHGLGIGQVTIKPGRSYVKKIDGPNGPEWAINIGGKWFTVTDLFNPDKTIEATVAIIKSKQKSCEKAGDYSKECIFRKYAGGPAGVPRAVEAYEDCPF